MSDTVPAPLPALGIYLNVIESLAGAGYRVVAPEQIDWVSRDRPGRERLAT